MTDTYVTADQLVEEIDDLIEEISALRLATAMELLVMRDAIGQVVEAVTDAGRAPHYHNRIMMRHRAEWPTLWRAIDRLVDTHNGKLDQ